MEFPIIACFATCTSSCAREICALSLMTFKILNEPPINNPMMTNTIDNSISVNADFFMIDSLTLVIFLILLYKWHSLDVH